MPQAQRNSSFNNQIPARGGMGGIPGGRCGENGLANYEFKSAGIVEGGQGGRSMLDIGGAGGDGGGASSRGRNVYGSFYVSGYQASGSAGQSGAVMLQMSSELIPGEVDALLDDNSCGTNKTAFGLFIGLFSELCRKHAAACNAADTQSLERARNDNSPYAARASIFSKGETIKKLFSLLPRGPTRLVVQWLINLPSDSRIDLGEPPPTLDQNLTGLTYGQLQEYYGAIIAAISYVETFPLSETNVGALENLRSTAQSIRNVVNSRAPTPASRSAEDSAKQGGSGAKDSPRGHDQIRDRENERKLREIIEKPGRGGGTGSCTVCEKFREWSCESFPC